MHFVPSALNADDDDDDNYDDYHPDIIHVGDVGSP